MSVFERKYREPLQAKSWITRVGSARCSNTSRRATQGRKRWLVGRRAEVGLVVRLRVRDWRADRIGLDYAARTIGAYLDGPSRRREMRSPSPANVPAQLLRPR